MKITKILKNQFKNFISLQDLNNLADVPSVIYAIGNLDLLKLPTLTVIGSRKISSYGKQVIKDIVTPIAQSGICIVSGVAYGCDFQAQKTATQNNGTTIGIMGCGLNHIKTHQHYTFIKDCIASNSGLFLSEFEPDAMAAKYTFVKRDRIMAALGSKLLVIEASLKSGTMHTVNFALELGKEVYAVPGNIYNSNSLGTNLLIQNGANVLLQSSDILDQFNLDINTSGAKSLTKEQSDLLNMLSNEKTTLELAKEAKQNVSVVLSQLTLLEMQSVITRVGDKWVKS